MPLYRLRDVDEPLESPVIVAAFDGWIDAGGASTAAADHIAGKNEPIVTFASDLLYDYRSRRPVLDIVDGTLTELTWPDLTMKRVHVDQRDVLILTGPEPDFRWRELGADILEVATRLGVMEWVSIGAIPAAVPHTRPVPILATASKPGLLRDNERQGPDGLLRVPSAALSTIEMAVTGGGIPAVGFYAQVPHYVGGTYPAATIAILEYAQRHLGVAVPLGGLTDEALSQRQRLDQAVAADEDSTTYVARLESVVDNEELPTGDELVSEIERFLQQRDGGAGQPPLG
ncbi:MAG: proteasome assembly chaperone family protein [Actinomycetota bacterium]